MRQQNRPHRAKPYARRSTSAIRDHHVQCSGSRSPRPAHRVGPATNVSAAIHPLGGKGVRSPALPGLATGSSELDALALPRSKRPRVHGKELKVAPPRVVKQYASASTAAIGADEDGDIDMECEDASVDFSNEKSETRIVQPQSESDQWAMELVWVESADYAMECESAGVLDDGIEWI